RHLRPPGKSAGYWDVPQPVHRACPFSGSPDRGKRNRIYLAWCCVLSTLLYRVYGSSRMCSECNEAVMVEAGHPAGNAIRYIIHRLPHGLFDGVKETSGLCIAVALDDNALQPQQACTVEFGRVDLFTQITQQRRRQPGTKTAEPVSVGAFAHRVFND